VKELVATLASMLEAKGKLENPRDLLLDVSDRVVRTIAPAFRVENDEVAILMLSRDGKHLKFAAPRRFADLGSIPVTKRDSIAVNILGKKVGEAINNVRMVKHVAFFESVKLREKADPIQKMITVPILDGAEAVGVAQISRKGESAGESGADFTDGDVRRAQEMFQSVGPFLSKARPDKF
jgi:hypothetical protein